MARTFRRRRNNGTWLPNTGSVVGTATLPVQAGALNVSITAGIGDVTSTIIPVIYDRPAWDDQQSPNTRSLGELIGNEYFLDRIVGKLFVQRLPNVGDNDDDIGPAVYVKAGFFVARAGDPGSASADLPIGTTTATLIRDNYSPLDNDNVREPYIWLKSWILGAVPGYNYNPPDLAAGFTSYPSTNVRYGSVADGPTVDAKTKRRIHQEERLWFIISAMNYPLGTVAPDLTQQSILWMLDVRYHGALRKARNTGTM